MAKIVHLTSVHSPYDNRIFHRECRSLADAGHEVVLVVFHDRDECVDGVRIRGISRPSGRPARMALGTWRLLRAGLRERGDVYHFHDPELIPAALLLRIMGKKVVYDVHEDYVTAIMEREYLPRSLRRAVSLIFEQLENFSSRFFAILLAERYYAERFPRGELILNYSRFPELDQRLLDARPRAGRIRLIYTGNLKVYRGALNHAAILQNLPEAELFMIGRCSPDLAAQIRELIGDRNERLHLEGEGYYVPFERITECYLREQWTAGLAVFPPGQHTLRKELTKIFEYMAYEIPVVCSDFPNLKRIIEGEGCGICVDPQDPQAVAAAVGWLADHPEEARAMGRRGRAAARAKFNWETQAEKLLRFYDELCPSSSP